LGKTSLVGELRNQLCRKIQVPLTENSLVLMHDGKTMADEKTLSDNSVVLPGPARRRAGEMVKLFFDLTWDEQERQRQEQEAVASEIIHRQREEAARIAKRKREEEYLIAQAKKEEQLRRQREEEERQAAEAKRIADAEAAVAQVLANLPMEIKRIHYDLEWGIKVEQRLREIAEMAGITLQDCVRRASIVGARGTIIEAFSGDVVPMKEDFPFVIVFGPVSVSIQGPTHVHLRSFAVENDNGLPRCWDVDAKLNSTNCVAVDPCSEEFNAVTSYFRGTLGWLPTICGVQRVQNHNIYTKFKGRGEPGLTMMFHGCRSMGNETNILQNGFQVSKCISGGHNYGTWCAYASAYSDSGFVFVEGSGIRHIFLVVVSHGHVVLDNPTMRVVGQDSVYPLWLITYQQQPQGGPHPSS